MMRDLDTIAAELRMLTADGHDADRLVDDLLDEWNGSRAVLHSYGLQFWPD
ncbi:hypothetical protein [Mycolicibacterium sediminis]|uniref:Uncharacterized protein n=1 Tax=Mycolicibacterium sediminis TaxID=1286180 RepID=A0A7I7QQ05_9MYCO|nr:hypothetical protein [Mycolicibacterium sediminis]BBY28401.1 hypothetical protein MSEDJ_24970 [Mycolicibacterium sediminis]